MKRRVVTLIAMLAMMATVAVPTTVKAADGVQPGSMIFNQDSFGEGKFGLTMDYLATITPTYTVTVPQSLKMEAAGTDVSIKVENVAHLADNGKYLSVKVRDTWAHNFSKAYRDEAHMYNLYRGYNFMSFDLQPKLSDGTYGEELTQFDQELLSFTEDGTQYYKVTPGNDNTEEGTYWGAINFQIELADLS